MAPTQSQAPVPRGLRVLFLCLGTIDLASSRVRVYQYLPHLRNSGLETRVIPYVRPLKTPTRKTRVGGALQKLLDHSLRLLRMLRFLLLAPWYDVVFVQKVVLPGPVQGFLRLAKVALVYDLDDAIYTAPAGVPGPNDRVLRRLTSMLKGSRYVVSTNDCIGDFVRSHNQNIVLIVGPIDCTRYFPKPKIQSPKIAIGWIGSPATTRYLTPMRDVFTRLSQSHPNVTFVLIGAGNVDMPEANVICKKWTLATEVEDLQNLDIGIMPLPDEPYARGKGGYKLLQYMAVGIPCVASPVGIKKEIVRDGVNGFLALSDDDWVDRLSQLVVSVDLRRRMGAEGRKMATDLYSLEVTAPRLMNVLKRAASSNL